MGGSWRGHVADFARADLLFLTAPALVALLASWVRYGDEALRPGSPGLLVLASGAAGGVAYVTRRRAGSALALALAIVVLALFRVPPTWSDPPRMAWSGLAWSLVSGCFLLAALLLQHASRAWMGFGRFIPAAIVLGCGFVVAGLLFGIVNRVAMGGSSFRIQFAIGSLAGAATGLGLELVEEYRARRMRRARAGLALLLAAGATLGIATDTRAVPAEDAHRLVTYRAATMGTVGGITRSQPCLPAPVASKAPSCWRSHSLRRSPPP